MQIYYVHKKCLSNFHFLTFLWYNNRHHGSISPTPGLNFINVLRTAFMCADPRSIKKTVKFSIFFTLSRPMSVKAQCKTLVKLTPGAVVKNVILFLQQSYVQLYQRKNLKFTPNFYILRYMLWTSGRYHQIIVSKGKFAGSRSLVKSVSPTKLLPTLQANTNRSYTQLLCLIHYDIHQ